MRKITPERQARNDRWHFGKEPDMEGGMMMIQDTEQDLRDRNEQLEQRISKAREILRVADRYDRVALLKALEQTLEGALEEK